MLRDPEGIESTAIKGIDALYGVHLLEIGCGDGRLTRQFSELAAHVTAIDMDAALVATAEAHLNIGYAAASAIDLPFPSEQFDTALLAWSL